MDNKMDNKIYTQRKEHTCISKNYLFLKGIIHLIYNIN